jgi:hypothetical protein
MSNRVIVCGISSCLRHRVNQILQIVERMQHFLSLTLLIYVLDGQKCAHTQYLPDYLASSKLQEVSLTVCVKIALIKRAMRSPPRLRGTTATRFCRDDAKRTAT